MKETFIKLEYQMPVLNELQNTFNSQNKLIFLLGKSGVGKSFLLKHLALKQQFILFEQAFFEEESLLQSLNFALFKDKNKIIFNDFYTKLKQNTIKQIIILDEASMYKEELLEKIRMLSENENLSFILALHKKQGLLLKEHFSSRAKELELKGLNLEDLKLYIFKKHQFQFKKAELQWLLKKNNYNLRLLNNLLISFKELLDFYSQNKQKKSSKTLLELSALYHKLIG